MKPRLCMIMAFAAACTAGVAQAQTCTNIATGNWNTAANWNCTLPAGARVPTNADDVTVINNTTVTVNIAGAVAGSVTISGGANATSLTMGGVGTTLTVTNAGGRSGNVAINGPSAGVTKQISVGARSLTVTGSVTITGGTTTSSNNNIAQLAITSGTATIGSLMVNGGTINSIARATVTTGTLNVTGDADVATGTLGRGLMTLAAGTINIGGNLGVSSAPSLNNSGDATVTVSNAAGLLNVSGNATVTGTPVGGANNRDALLNVTVASNPGRGIAIGGALDIIAGIAGSATVSLGTNSRMSVAGNVNNGDTLTIGAGLFTMSTPGTTLTTFNNAVAATTSVTTGTLDARNVVVDSGNLGLSRLLLSSTGTINVQGDLGVTTLASSATAGDATAEVTNAGGLLNVTGNATVTGGAAADRDALLRVTVASNVGRGIAIAGNLDIVATVAGSSTVTLGTGSRMTVSGDVNNGDALTVGAGLFTMSTPGTTLTTRNNAVAATTSVSTGTLDARNVVVDSGSLGLSRLLLSSTGTINVQENLSVTAVASTANAGDATAEVTNAGGLLNVTGNATVTGGNPNNEDAVLRVTVASNPGRGIIIGGNLDVNSTVAGSSAVTLGTGSLMTVGGAVTNNDTVTVGAGTLTVTGDYTNNNQTFAVATTVSTGTLTVGGVLTNAATETITISSTGIVNANGGFTNSGTFTNTAAGQLFLRGAANAINGTFNDGTGTVTMNGGAAQALSGSALFPPTTAADGFYNLVIDNAAGVTLGSNVVARNLITFASGEVTTGANVLISEPSCATPSVTRVSGHVVGNFQKLVPAGASTCNYEVGTAGAYTPASLAFTGATAGRLIVRSTAADHPNVNTSGFTINRTVNRYWTLTTTGVTGTALTTFTSYAATLTFINPGDMDAGIDTALFEIKRWSGAAWFNTTVGTRTATTTQATGITALGELQIGEAGVPPPGSFNAFETATGAGLITGVIRTRRAGVAFSLDVVAISAGAQLAGFTDDVRVDLLGNNTLGVALDGNNCPTSFTVLQIVSPDPTITTGRSTVNFAAVADAWRDVRVRVRWPTGAPTVTSCSTDNFAIRPDAFAAFAASNATRTTAGLVNALNSTVFGATVHNAGRPFSVRANAVNGAGSPAITTNYAGTPAATTAVCGPGGGFEACTASTGTLSLGTTFVSGQLVSDVAQYNDVGAFSVQLTDSDFAAVDAGDGSTLPERQIASAVINVGRFTPDNFTVAFNAPVFAPACSGFTYNGQIFNYGTAPVILVTARDANGNITPRYTGAWWRLTNSTLTPATQASRYAAASGTLDTSGLPATAIDPVVVDSGNGTGTLTFSGGSGLGFTRNSVTPSAEFDADIALSLNVIDADSVSFSGNPAMFGAATAGNGILFSDGDAGTTNDKRVRYGRLRLGGGSGSQLLFLSLPVEAQYWSGSSFIVNSLDNCTSLVAGNVGLANFLGSLNPGETVVTITSSPLQAGRSTIRLSAPGSGNAGSVDAAVNLGSGASADACPAFAPVATGANLEYLRGAWCGGTATRDPAARARFGVRGNAGESIHNRESYK